MQDRIKEIIHRLALLYPEAACSLDFDADYELLFSTRLSAQCTDARVNLVTRELYRVYPTLEALAGADIEDMERMVHSCGFYHQKARDIIRGAQLLLAEHGGRVPDSMDALLRLPGVGRKTANLVLGELYGRPGVVVDTHCIRLSNRLGLCDSRDADKVEQALLRLIPAGEQLRLSHRFVLHGRAVCPARQPRCADCTLRALCPYGNRAMQKHSPVNEE